MRIIKLITISLAVFSFINRTYGQANASINILTGNTGIVDLNGTVLLQVTVNNTGPTSNIGVYKIKCQITVPTAIASIAASQAGLPTGWTINSQTAGAINLSNGTDVIEPNTARNFTISIQGNALGGPSTVGSQLSFSNGNAPGSGPGTLAGDNPADNASQSTIEVVSTTPVTLSNFEAALINCEPVLSWLTSTEINSAGFQVERSNLQNSNWLPIGIVQANGNSSSKHQYSFTDKSISGSSEQVLYRLRMFDKDGRYKYSPILRVSTNCKVFAVQAYPNPAKHGALFISVTGAVGNAEVILTSLSGQVIMKRKVSNGSTYINTSGIPSGLYFLNIEDSKGGNKKIKVIVHN